MSTDEVKAHAAAWKLLVGVADSFVLEYAIEKRIVEAFNIPGTELTLTELDNNHSHRCTNHDVLRRLMKYLVHMGIFTVESGQREESYKRTPLVKLFLERKEIRSDKGLITLLKETSASLAVELFLAWVRGSAARNVFNGVDSLVDVGGGSSGTVARSIVKAFPDCAKDCTVLYDDNSKPTEHPVVKFKRWNISSPSIPQAKAVMLMSVLDKWGDNECVELLRKCLRAIPQQGGKVIIVTNIIGHSNTPEYERAVLGLDVMKVALTGGKERTKSELTQLLTNAGFRRTKETHVQALPYVIEAFP